MKYGLFPLAALSLVLAGCFGPDTREEGDGGPPVLPVIVEEARSEHIVQTVDLVGTLLANESVTISPEIAGTIASIHFEEGDRVEKGDVLLRLDDSKLRARLREAQAAFELAESNLGRSRRLLERELISPSEHDQRVGEFAVAEATLNGRQEELRDATLEAPFAGVMGERRVSPGGYIEVGEAVSTLVDVTPVRASFEVPERHFRKLSAGRTIELEVPAHPGRTFAGEVYFVSPVIAPSSRTVLVKASVPNDEMLLKPGMFGTLALSLEVRDESVVVPESAVFQRGESPHVYVVSSDNRTDLRPVTIGLRQAGSVEILSGLEAGETVIVEGVQKVFFPGAEVEPRQRGAG
ncbi:MAG: efflux RND transporter periplasmic adaptor subunit [Puniceicoccaceae bacterium]